jgi:hypothetical protein
LEKFSPGAKIKNSQKFRSNLEKNSNFNFFGQLGQEIELFGKVQPLGENQKFPKVQSSLEI